MKITILANRDVASNVAINNLLPRLSEHEVCIFLSSRVGGDKARPAPLQRLRFFEQELFDELIFPLLPQQVTDSSRKLMSFDQIQRYIGTPIRPLNNINSPDGYSLFMSSAPDLVVSIRYGVILKEPIIKVPKQGVVNLHSGLLPAYRGVMATFWAMLNGERTIGTTLHYISDDTIDTGEIIAKSSLVVDPGKSYWWHVLQLYEQGCGLLADTIDTVASGQTVSSRKPAGGGSYYSFPGQKELDDFHQQGFRLFDEREIIDYVTSRYY